MRVLAAMTFCFIAAMAQAATAAESQSLPPGVSSEEAHAGCLHTQLRACMIALGTAFWFDMKTVAPRIAQRNELDVNGKMAHRRLSLDVRLPLGTTYTGITLILASPAPNDEVVKIELWLSQDPENAHTASEYDRTMLYDAVSALLGSKCPGLDKLALYRFYENTIKPREQAKTVTQKYGIFHYTTKTVDTEKAAFCGAMFSLHRRIEFSGTPDMPNRDPKTASFIEIE
ncbi:MAG TPA: hypothetical protein VM782_08060 [Stellaceae bacterium]|nr:hypothetical protein [Stellaceae bacterium]